MNSVLEFGEAVRDGLARALACKKDVAMGLLASVLGAASTPACGGDPVREQKIAALGPEDPFVRAGAFHRPNQPCLLCHSQGGNARPMVIAGTVFREPQSREPVSGVDVLMIDSARRAFSAKSNCAGNFFVFPEDAAPTFPVWVSLRRGDHQIDMESALQKDGDCGACHRDPADRESAGHIFLDDNATRAASIPVAQCP